MSEQLLTLETKEDLIKDLTVTSFSCGYRGRCIQITVGIAGSFDAKYIELTHEKVTELIEVLSEWT